MRKRTMLVMAAVCLGLVGGCASRAMGSAADPSEPRRVAQQVLPPVPEGFKAREESGVWLVVDSSADSEMVTITVAGSGCLDLEHVAVAEGSEAITIEAVMRELVPSEGFGCTLPLFTPEVTFSLLEPLGDRRILGACEEGRASDGLLCTALTTYHDAQSLPM